MCLFLKQPLIEKLFGARKPSPQTPVPTTGTVAPSISLAANPVSKEPEHRFGWQVVHEPRDAKVCIIFVHGLGGSATTTWTHSNTGFWPAWLSTEKGFENARVVVFAYNADYKNVFARRNVLGIAKELLDALDLYYHKDGDVISLDVHH
jgi:hypothetical protein